MRAAHRADERALADVREAEQADVGHDLELEAERSLLARFAGLGSTRRTLGRRGEVLVAAAAAPAFRHDDARFTVHDLIDLFARLGVDDHGADGDADLEVAARFAVTVFALAVFASLGAQHREVREIVERAEPFVGDEDDVAAAPAVAARGPAHRYVLFAPKRDDAATAVAGFDPDVTLVDESHGRALEPRLLAAGRGLGQSP